jgi:hypothetical protein
MRRFMKLESKSPSMAVAATKPPIFQSSPISGATAVVAKIESARPRSVFDDPKRGLPSVSSKPPSMGKARNLPNSFSTKIGVPLATANRVRAGRLAAGALPRPLSITPTVEAKFAKQPHAK